MPTGESISDDKKKTITYIGHNTRKLLRRLTLHPSDSSSICHQLQKHNCLNVAY